MKNIERNISNLVNRFIRESFVDITDMDTDEAFQEVTEKAHGKGKKFGDGRDNIDVAEPKGKITGADFKKLRSMNKKEMGENYGMEDEMGGGYYKYDNPNRHKAAKLADRFPGVTFTDDDLDKSEDELTADYERIMGKKRTPAGFEFGELVAEEGETEEGNAFTGALAKAKKEGRDTFTVDGEEYNVTKESVNKKIERILERRRSRLDEKWKGNVEVEKTGEYSDMSIEDLNSAIKKQKDKNDKTKEAGKKVSDSDKTKMSQLYFAKRAKQGWKGKGKAAVKENKVVFTESELIDFIERIVEAETKEDKATMKSLKGSKSVNDKAISDTVKKMKDYMKNMGMEYQEDAKKFPKGNSEMSREDFGKEVTDGKKKAYKPSDAVGEYIEAFAYPGQTGLVYDEIKPVEEKIEMYLKGNSKTGNAQKDEEGNDLGNVVSSEVGDKFFENYKENLYGAEQQEASYKRVSQPVDVAGEETQEGHLSKFAKKSKEIFDKLDESVNSKKVVNDVEKMKKLFNYNQRTQ